MGTQRIPGERLPWPGRGHPGCGVSRAQIPAPSTRGLMLLAVSDSRPISTVATEAPRAEGESSGERQGATAVLFPPHVAGPRFCCRHRAPACSTHCCDVTELVLADAHQLAGTSHRTVHTQGNRSPEAHTLGFLEGQSSLGARPLSSSGSVVSGTQVNGHHCCVYAVSGSSQRAQQEAA